MRISDWSSDVCSSDLGRAAAGRRRQGQALRAAQLAGDDPPAVRRFAGQATDIEIQAREILTLRQRLNEILSRSEERREGKSVSVRVDLGGTLILKKTKNT